MNQHMEMTSNREVNPDIFGAKQICFFAPDIAEIAQRRRIKGFRAAGCTVMSVSFAKKDGQLSDGPDWPNVSLGSIENGHLLKRFWALVLVLPLLLIHRERFRDADVFIARNLDMLILAWLARLICSPQASLVYECLDIHGIFTRPGIISPIARWVERWFLRRIDFLIISSPDFLTHYFRARQGYQGRWHLMENKLWFDSAPLARPTNIPCSNRPLTIGWVGTIRCEPSFQILLEVAKRFEGYIRFEIHGQIHRHVIKNFDSRIARLRNVSYHGTYRYPYGLQGVYERLDMVWAQDLWQTGANSNWLLPNRIYEAAWFGCPSLAVSSTRTGQYIQTHGLGWTVPEANPDHLVKLIKTCTPHELFRVKQRLFDMSEGAFRLFPEDYQYLSNRLETCNYPQMRHSHA